MKQIKISPGIMEREAYSVGSYLRDIGKVKMISADEEVLLAEKIRQGDADALEQLAKGNLRFVVSIAKQYQHMGLPLSDLISEGNLGLIHAAKKFDGSQGFKFISFAVWWIRKNIMRAISEQPRMIRLPKNKVEAIIKINQAILELEQQTQRVPSIDDLAAWLGLAEREVALTLQWALRTSSYDAPVMDSEDSVSLLDVIPSNDMSADSPLLVSEFAGEMKRLLNILSDREKEVMELSFGLTGGPEMTPHDISLMLGLSRERVRQIRNTALKKLQQNSHILFLDL